MKKICVVVSVALAVVSGAMAAKTTETKPTTKPAKKLMQQFGGLFRDFGKGSTTKVKIVSGPTAVKMNRARTPGKQWIATRGPYRFKLSIEDSTKLPLEKLVARVEKLPLPYVRACQVVSDEREDGVAVYKTLGGAAAHGGKQYINTVAGASAPVIAHEVGHSLEQAARESDPKLVEKWQQAIKGDNVSVSGYGDTVWSEDLAEFAKVYAACLDGGPEYLKQLKALSPRRFAMWERILKAPPPQRSMTEPLWNGTIRGAKGFKDNETVTERDARRGGDRSVANVHTPTLTIHLPAARRATGAAVVICPGGGYGRCVVDKEGHDVARWLNSIGVAGIVLKYRLPRGQGYVYGHTVPLIDAQRAIRTVRHRAKEWNLKPDRVGIMGFSAGGHLAATAGVRFDDGSPSAADPIDRLSCRPDFMVLVYPVISFSDAVGHSGSRENLLGATPDPKLVTLYSNELQVTAETPPTFLVSTSDDSVKAENSINFYLALRKAKVPAALHVYEKGGHGYGVKRSANPVSTWPQQCGQWLKTRKLSRDPAR